MARRRSAQAATSLDLFLDTICNAFGGIMFISILISILVQMRGTEADSQAAVETITVEEAETLQTEIENIQSKVVLMTQSISDRERLLFSEGTADVRALQERVNELRQKAGESTAVQTQMISDSAQLDQAIQAIDLELRDLSSQLQEARIAVSERAKELENALDAVETTMTLPKVSKTQKGNLLFAFRYGRLYLLSDVDGTSKLGVNEQHATAKKTIAGVEVQLKPSAGWDIHSAHDLADITSITRTHPASTTFFSVAVFSDSFPQFLEWKKSLVPMGYDYDLIPFEEVESFVISSASEAQVQ
jgi:hypothetical protein